MTEGLKVCIIFLLGIVLKRVSSETVYNCISSSPCGCSTYPAVLTKIVGGESAASQTWGWAASLRYTSSGSHFCGGSIISNMHILTAAHCTVGLSTPAAVLVYVGSIYIDSTVPARTVSAIYIHPNYSASTFVNDISILKLTSPITLGQNGMNPVCLPNISTSVLAAGEYPPLNTNLIAVGWGYTSEGSGLVSSNLQQVTIQTVAANSTYCQNVQIADSSKQFCAGVMPAGGKDTCQGDSGGPLLMFNSNNVWEEVGVTSSGVGCARPNNPGLYTRVAAYQDWIQNTMNSANSLPLIAYNILIPIILLKFFYN